MNNMSVLIASKLFSSNSDIHRTVKQKGVKINGLVVEDVNELIELKEKLFFMKTLGKKLLDSFKNKEVCKNCGSFMKELKYYYYCNKCHIFIPYPVSAVVSEKRTGIQLLN